MNEKEILLHLQSEIPETRFAAAEQYGSLFDVGKRIIEAIRKIIGMANVNVDAAVLAARTFFFGWATAHGIPPIVANVMWSAIEWAIREMFSQVIEEGAT